MIKRIVNENIPECVALIRASFLSVADEFGFTEDNAPRFTAFATTDDKLNRQLDEGCPMFAYFNDEAKIIGYYSLNLKINKECELNNLCVLYEYRHKNIGKELIEHAFSYAKQLGYKQMNIGIVEENVKLKQWYMLNGAEHLGTKKFDSFPFTCGYMKKIL